MKIEEIYPQAYRFIIPNKVLGQAIGREMPEKTWDIIGEIMAAEGF